MAIMDAERSNHAREVIQQILHKVKTNLVEQKCFLARDPDDISPWGLFFAYRLCVDHIRSGERASGPDFSEVIKSLKETFVKIDARWNVAGISSSYFDASYEVSVVRGSNKWSRRLSKVIRSARSYQLLLITYIKLKRQKNNTSLILKVKDYLRIWALYHEEYILMDNMQFTSY
jgi:hypothetical protein